MHPKILSGVILVAFLTICELTFIECLKQSPLQRDAEPGRKGTEKKQLGRILFGSFVLWLHESDTQVVDEWGQEDFKNWFDSVLKSYEAYKVGKKSPQKLEPWITEMISRYNAQKWNDEHIEPFRDWLRQISQSLTDDHFEHLNNTINTEKAGTICDPEVVTYLMTALKQEQKEEIILNRKLQDLVASAKVKEIEKKKTCPIKRKHSYRQRRYPSSCAEAVKKTGNRAYLLQVIGNDTSPFYAYCMDDPRGPDFGRGRAWTVLLRRFSGKINFFRTMAEYENGFGAIYHEHWLGLKAMHALTNNQLHELLIGVEAFDGEIVYEKYKYFAIQSKQQGYSINLLGVNGGDAGDSLMYHVGSKFSTRDRPDKSNCSIRHQGGWWYNNCVVGHLTGPLKDTLDPAASRYKTNMSLGMFWPSWNFYQPLKGALMAIRPIV